MYSTPLNFRFAFPELTIVPNYEFDGHAEFSLAGILSWFVDEAAVLTSIMPRYIRYIQPPIVARDKNVRMILTGDRNAVLVPLVEDFWDNKSSSRSEFVSE